MRSASSTRRVSLLVQAQANRYADTAALFQALGGAGGTATRRAPARPDRARPRHPKPNSHSNIRTEKSAMKPSMKKRMIIMLVLVGVLLGGIVGFNVFKGLHDAEIHGVRACAGGDGQRDEGRLSAMAAADATRSARCARSRGVDVTTEVAGLVRSTQLQIGRRGQGGPGARCSSTPTPRSRSSNLAAGRGRPRRDGLRARSSSCSPPKWRARRRSTPTRAT